MNIYRIWQTENDWWDTWDSAIVAAENEEEARNIHPSGLPFEEAGRDFGWVNDPTKVMIELLGTAKEGAAQGLILASFNAG